MSRSDLPSGLDEPTVESQGGDISTAPDNVIRRLTELSSELLCVLDSKGYFVWLSPGFSRILGWSMLELRSQPVRSFVHPLDVEDALDVSRRLMLGEPIVGFEHRFHCKDEGFRWLEWNVVLGEDGLLYGSVRDVTEKKAEALVAEKRLRWLEAIDHLSDVGYWRVDLATSEVQWSNGVYGIHRRDRHLAPPTLEECIEFYHPEDQEQVLQSIETAISGQGDYQFQLRLLFENDEISWVESFGRCEVNEAGQPIGLFGAIRDVTSQKNILDNLEHRNSELEQFAFGAAKGMYEPVETIYDIIDNFKGDAKTELDSPIGQSILSIETSTRRMQRLIRSLVEYSEVRQTSTSPSPVDLNRVLGDVQKDVASLLESTQGTLQIDPMPVVMGYSLWLRRLFRHLVENSLKFHGEQVPKVRVRSQERQEDWLFSVVDNGMGFSVEDIENIFRPFYKLGDQEESNGAGIGLTICKKIVAAHGGELGAGSMMGHGSTFYFNLAKV